VIAIAPSPSSSAKAAADPLDKHLWSLTRDRRIATCWQRWDVTGIELRVDVDGHLRHRRIVTSRANALSDSLRWRTLMVERGWARA
jgi:hypothetical protein